jgi:predicted alpha/beta superfamily hydrolase
MRLTRVMALLALALPALVGNLPAQTLAAAPAMGPSTLPASMQNDFTSKINGRSYRVRVALPFAAPPPGGYPALYVLDGDGYFHGVAEAARLRQLGAEIEAAVVVGIGYPEAESFAMVLHRRTYDLTPTRGSAEFAAADKAASGMESESGGADLFFKVIQEEIKPRIAETVKVDPRRSLLWGHSLGGLFVLHTMFNHPEAFQTFLAQSPSIWWDGKSVLRNEQNFSRAVAGRKTAPGVFIGVGGTEQDPPKLPASTPADVVEKTKKRIVEAAMIDNAVALAARLKALKGGPGYRVESHVFNGASHMSVPYAALNAMLDFSLPAPPPVPPAK